MSLHPSPRNTPGDSPSFTGCRRHHLHSGVAALLATTSMIESGYAANGGDGGFSHLLECDDEQAAIERATRAFELEAAKSRISSEKELREFARDVFRREYRASSIEKTKNREIGGIRRQKKLTDITVAKKAMTAQIFDDTIVDDEDDEDSGDSLHGVEGNEDRNEYEESGGDANQEPDEENEDEDGAANGSSGENDSARDDKRNSRNETTPPTSPKEPVNPFRWPKTAATKKRARFSRLSQKSAITKPRRADSIVQNVHHHHHYFHPHDRKSRWDLGRSSRTASSRSRTRSASRKSIRALSFQTSNVNIPLPQQRAYIRRMADLCINSLYKFSKRHNLPITRGSKSPQPRAFMGLSIGILTGAIIRAYNGTAGAGTLPEGVIDEDRSFGFVAVFEAATVLDDAVIYSHVLCEDWRLRGVLANGVDLLTALKDKAGKARAEAIWRECEWEIFEGMLRASNEKTGGEAGGDSMDEDEGGDDGDKDVDDAEDSSDREFEFVDPMEGGKGRDTESVNGKSKDVDESDDNADDDGEYKIVDDDDDDVDL